MTVQHFIYEIFIIRNLVWEKMKGRSVHVWSWRQLNMSGLIAVHGNQHSDMQTAFHAAMAYRDQTGGAGSLKINLDGVIPANARNTRYLADGYEVEAGLRAIG